MTESRVHFSYWTDPLCIWALVAQPKHERALARYGSRLQVDYRTVPVFGSVGWRFEHGPWAAQGVDGRVEATRRIAVEHGREDVTGEVWRTAQPASSWSPGAAVKACFACERAGHAEEGTAQRFLIRLRERFFVDNVNVALRSEQLTLAEELGLPRAPIERHLDDGSALAMLWEDHQEKERLRVQGSPTYVFDGGHAQLYGNFPYAILEATLEALVGGGPPGASAC